jgi:hypothetical protein
VDGLFQITALWMLLITSKVESDKVKRDRWVRHGWLGWAPTHHSSVQKDNEMSPP